MINLSISEVENWLLNETNRSLAPLRKKAKSFVDEITEYLKSIRKEADSIAMITEKMSKEGRFDKACKVASTFSEKIINILDNFSVPQEYDYRSLSDLKKRSDKLLRTIIELGPKYIPRMSTSSFKSPIMKMDYYVKSLAKLRGKLGKFLETRYIHAKYIEETISRVKKLQEEEKKFEEMQRRNEENKKRLEELLKIKNNLKTAIKEKKEILRTEDIENHIYKVKNDIRNLLAPLDKPLRKFLNLVDRGEVKLTKKQKLLLNKTNDLKKPIASLEEVEILKELLRTIEKLILSKKLKFDEKKAKKIMKSIQVVLKENTLDKLVEKYMSLRKEKRSLEKIYEKDIENVKKLEDQLKELQKDISNLKEEVKSGEKEIENLKKTILLLKGELEKGIERIVNRPVEITLSLTSLQSSKDN